jgi:hypothetical protein
MKNRMLPRPQEPAPSVAGATLAVAAVFQLVRRHIQSGGRPALQPAQLQRRPDDQHMARK